MKFVNLIIAALILTLSAAHPAEATSSLYTRTSTTQAMNTYVPTSGATVTLPRSNDTVAVLNPAADLALLTIAMPSSPKDGDLVSITSNKNIAAVTFTNGVTTNAPVSFSTGSSFSMVYSAALGTWNQKAGIGGSGGLDKIAGATGSIRGALVRLTSGAYGLAASFCSLVQGDATACAKLLGYADPRQFGASCAGNSSVDDSAGIQAALDTHVPVMIPYPFCTVTNKINFSRDGDTIFSFGSGGRYNSNIPGNPYIFVNNGLWDNRATSLNCAIDTRGYDNVTIKNLAFRGNFNLVGSVAMCNSVGLQGGRAAAFLNLQDVACLNMGNCIGAAMTSYFDYLATSTDTVTLGTGSKSFTVDVGRLWAAGNAITVTATGISPTTSMTGTVTRYDSATGDLVVNVTTTAGTAGTYSAWTASTSNYCTPITTGAQGGLANNVFQMRIKGLDMIGTCMGLYANGSDVHLSDFYGANVNHNIISSLDGFGSAWDITLGRVEYSGFGAGPSTDKKYVNDGAGMYFSGPFGYNVSNVTCDHQYGTCLTLGGGHRYANISNIMSIDSNYTAASGIVNRCHFGLNGTMSANFSNITTRKNAVDTPYVFCDTGASSFTASISGTTMTVTTAPTAGGRINVGQSIVGGGVLPGTYVTVAAGGGGTGNYTLSRSQTVASTTLKLGNSYLSISGASAPTNSTAGFSTSYFGWTNTPENFTYNVIGVGAAIPDLTLTKVVRSGTADSVAAGAGAGTTPTIAIAGAAGVGKLTLTTGTSTPGSNATIATITYSNACPTASQVILSPANNNAAALAVGARPFATGSATTATLTSGATGLTDSTQYIWDYMAVCR